MGRVQICIPLAGVLALGGCSDISQEQQRTLSGGAIGAAAGTAIGAIAGHTVWGLAIGAAAGAAGGYLLNQYQQGQQSG
jgi:uncharacterized protein YcfJ